MDHAPLTPHQQQLMAQLDTGPIRDTLLNLEKRGWNSQDISFLVNAQLIGFDRKYVAQEFQQSVYEIAKR